MAELLKVDQLSIMIEKNPDVTRIGVFSIAIGSLLIALRRARPFTRFTKPSDIPKRFIKIRTKLNGTVERIEPSGALLMVQHRPLLQIMRLKRNCLPVKISGITVNGNGLSWLQSIVSGNKITFIPVLKQQDYVQCEITMQQKTRENKVETLHVGPAIVSIGFGKVDPIEKVLTNDSFYKEYYKTLKKAEIVAERKRLGKWYYVKSTQEVTYKVARLFLAAILAMFRTSTKPKKPIENPKPVVNKIVST